MLVDSHCHLDFPAFVGRVPEIVARARENGVTRMVTISTRVRRVAECRAIAEAHPEVLFTIGTHPHNAAEEADVTLAEILAETPHARCVAIGEAGLDYHYDRSPRDVQADVLRIHIEAARQSSLPLVIHSRDADDDMIRILGEEMGRGRFDAVLHCFSSTERLAQAGVELGLYVSFSGILTFKNSVEIRRIAASLPLDRLLIETDAPYLAPAPHRGATNEPAFVRCTAEMLAETRGLSLDEIAAITSANFDRLFWKAAQVSSNAAEIAVT